jgi:uncharacterized surface protein with fasciclin (FAS1) repeats
MYPNYTNDLDDLLKAEPDASTFYDLILSTSFAPALKSGNTFTILAPSNAAFQGMDINALKEDPDALSELVRFHILGGTIDSKLLDLGGDFRTITSTSIRVEGGGDVTLFDSHGNSATLVKMDAFARNGVLHVISGVLEPPDAMMPPGPGNLAEELAGFGSLLAAATRAGLDLATVAGPVTVFAPNDAAFTALGDITGVSDDVLANIIRYHVVSGMHAAAELATNPTLDSQANIDLAVTGGGTMVGGAAVGAMTDIMATNGIAHELTAVAVPPTIVEYAAMANTMLARTSEAITRANATVAMALTPDTLGGDMPVTFFAPSGPSWTMAGIDTATAQTATLTAIIERHTVVGQLTVEDLSTMDMATLTTLNGDVTVEVDGTMISLVDADMNRFTITAAESDKRLLSGVVHVGEGILGQ